MPPPLPVSGMDEPTHTLPGPVIGPGLGLTVNVAVTLQPVGNV